MPMPQFLWKVKKSVEIEKKVLRERTWKEAGAGEENGTKSVRVQLKGKMADRVYLASSCSVRVFLATVGARSSGFEGSLVSGWGDGDGGKQMEDYSWPNCLCPANTPPSAERGSLRLSPPQQKPALSSAAIVWIWLMCPSLTCTSYRSSQCLSIPNHRFARHGRIIHCDIIIVFIGCLQCCAETFRVTADPLRYNCHNTSTY